MKRKLLKLVLPIFFLSLIGLNAQITINGGGSYVTIQSAIDAAGSGDVIYVPADTYTEDISIPATHSGLEIYGVGATSIIVGVDQEASANFPTAAPNIEILADGVVFHDFTVKNPAWVDGFYSSGMIVGAINVEIYNVDFVGPISDDLNDISQCFQTYHTVDISGLNLHDNTFTSDGSDSYGYEGIYINAGGTGTVTIDNNDFGGILFRGITTIRENVIITNNTLTSTQSGTHSLHVGINLDLDLGSGTLNDLTITGNDVSSFETGINVDGTVGSNFVVNNNAFYSNTTTQMDASDATGTVDAEENWWGDTDPTDDYSGDVDYSPWWGANYVGDAHATAWTWYTDDVVQDGIDAATAGDILNILAGTYTENVTVDKRLEISGAGSGSTSIESAASGSPVIDITAGGLDASNRLSVSDLTVSGALGGTGNPYSGIRVRNTSSVGYFTFDNLELDNNSGRGLVTDVVGTVTDLKVTNCVISNNGSVGLRIPSSSSIDGLEVTDTEITDNGGGLWINDGDSDTHTATNITVTGVDISGSGAPADFYLFGLDGPLSLTDVDFLGAPSTFYGLYLLGAYELETVAPAIPSVTLDDVVFSGTYPSGGMNILGWSDLANLSMNDVVFNETITSATRAHIRLSGVAGTLDVSNSSFDQSNSSNDIILTSNFNAVGSKSTVDVDALSATFGGKTGAQMSLAEKIAEEDRILHVLDGDPDALGLVTYADDFFYVTGGGAVLQTAIDESDPADTIYVGAGTYSSIIILQSLTLISTSGAVIDNASPAITVSADDVTIDGFTFSFDDTLLPYDDYAIYVSGDYENVIVQNCTFNNLLNGSSPGNAIDNNGGAGTHYVLAYENNDWGDPSGPTHSSNVGGIGGVISDYVIYEWDGLTSPVHSVSGVSVTPTFEWGEVGTAPAPNYRLIVSENSDLSVPLYSEEVGTATSVTIADTAANFPLDNNSLYYWSVDVLDDDNTVIMQPDTNYFYTLDDLSISVGHPANGAAIYAYDPMQFSWYLSQAQGSIKFMLQIKDSSAAPGPEGWLNYPDDEYYNISSIYKSVNGLDGGTRYYWRLIAYYDDGSGSSGSFDWLDRVVKISGEYYFDTQGGAVKAYPSWPIGGNLVYTLKPTFYWYTLQYQSNAQYTVLYSTSSATTGDSLTTHTELDAGTNSFVSVGTDLAASSDYYWQVRTSYNGVHTYSSVASFTTYDAPGIVPTKATLSYPTGGVTIYSTSPTLYWYIEGYNVNSIPFTVEYKLSSSGTWLTYGTTTTNTFLQVTGVFEGGKTYDWRVVHGTGGSAVTSDAATFTVAGGGASSPVLSWPTGNATVWTTTPTLSWYLEGSSLGWNNYVVRWHEGSSPSGGWAGDYDGTYSTASMNETFYTFTSAREHGKTYYWAVALYDGSTPLLDGDFVESSFTVAGGNATVTLSVPADNSTGVSKSPTFYWYTNGTALGVDKYKLLYSKTELFTAFKDSVETTSTYASVTGLESGATYWWKVYVSYDGGSTYSLASTTYSFTVDAGASAVMPLVGSPANGVSVSTSSPTLSWYLPTQSTSSLSYEVELANNKEFNDVVTYDNIEQLNAQVSELNNGEYFWRVRSNAPNSTSSYSNVGNFKVGDGVTSVDDGEELPLTYSIDQNYPNPFNPSTTINYSIPASSFVTIKIYDMLGQEVKALVNQEMKAGRHTLNWNGDNNYGYKVSSGTYIYRITAGNFVQSKKMILLK